ncbi:hypothetical protein LTR22_027147 [Elasticomyces elasticus]|nr:hypothetical protein LTR22_027147 [Elasticomyces elasticus]
MSVGARINRIGKGGVGNEDGMTSFGGWSHMVNLVTIRGEVFVIDVGSGPGGPALPLKLIDGKIKANMVATPQQAIRLRHDAIAENEHQNVKLWIFERRNNDNAPWVPMYCFEDNVCFLPHASCPVVLVYDIRRVISSQVPRIALQMLARCLTPRA